MDDKPICICDDASWNEYCEACDGPYEKWKAELEAEIVRLRKAQENY